MTLLSPTATKPAAPRWPRRETLGRYVVELPSPYLVFMGSIDDPAYAKTGLGLADWARERCVGQLRLTPATVSAGLTDLTVPEAAALGARALVVGVAPVGGRFAPAWRAVLFEALRCGLDIISGLHDRLAHDRELVAESTRLGRKLFDVREPPNELPVGQGVPRTGQRILTVGTDCALGKKYTALVLTRALQDLGLDADFRATGQTGIMISGSGIPIDSVVADFIAGAAEQLSPAADPAHVDVIEGQGSIFHPGYAGVSLGLLHGSQPDVLVLCHDPARTRVSGYPTFAMPDLPEAISMHLHHARRVNPAVRCAGVALNTSAYSDVAAAEIIEATARRLRLPVGDPVRGMGFDEVIEACL